MGKTENSVRRSLVRALLLYIPEKVGRILVRAADRIVVSGYRNMPQTDRTTRGRYDDRRLTH